MTYPPIEIQDAAYRLMASKISSAGLRLENHFRTSDKGFALSHEAATALKKTGYPGELPSVNSVASFGLNRIPFLHPLSESPEPDKFNMWAAASTLINAALGWIPEQHEKPSPMAIKNLTTVVFRASPSTDVSALLETARYSDRDLLKLAGLIRDGLQQMAEGD